MPTKGSKIIERLTDNSFSKALLAGFFAGIIGAIINLAYNVIYRSSTRFNSDEVVSPLIIFTAFPILLIISSWIYFLMIRHISHGRSWYYLFCAVVTAGSLYACSLASSGLLAGVGGLCAGMSIITGLLAAFLVPWLYGHPDIYHDPI